MLNNAHGGISLQTRLTFSLDEYGSSDNLGYSILSGNLTQPGSYSGVRLTLDKAIPDGIAVDAYVYNELPGTSQNAQAWWVPTARLSPTLFEAELPVETLDKYNLKCIFMLRLYGYLPVVSSKDNRLSAVPVPSYAFFPQAVRAEETRRGHFEGTPPLHRIYELIMPVTDGIEQLPFNLSLLISTEYVAKEIEKGAKFWRIDSTSAIVYSTLTSSLGTDGNTRDKVVYRLTLYDSPDFPAYIVLPEYSEMKAISLQLPPNGGRIYAPPGQYFMKRK